MYPQSRWLWAAGLLNTRIGLQAGEVLQKVPPKSSWPLRAQQTFITNQEFKNFSAITICRNCLFFSFLKNPHQKQLCTHQLFSGAFNGFFSKQINCTWKIAPRKKNQGFILQPLFRKVQKLLSGSFTVHSYLNSNQVCSAFPIKKSSLWFLRSQIGNAKIHVLI